MSRELINTWGDYQTAIDRLFALLEQKIFIYDEKDSASPLTIIAKSGSLVPDPDFPGHSVLLRLNNGDIHTHGHR